MELQELSQYPLLLELNIPPGWQITVIPGALPLSLANVRRYQHESQSLLRLFSRCAGDSSRLRGDQIVFTGRAISVRSRCAAWLCRRIAGRSGLDAVSGDRVDPAILTQLHGASC